MFHKLKRMLQSTLGRLGRQADREEKVLEKNSVIAMVPCRKPLPLQQKA